MLFSNFKRQARILDKMEDLVDRFDWLAKSFSEVLTLAKSREETLDTLLLAKVKESEAARKLIEQKLKREVDETPSEYDKRF